MKKDFLVVYDYGMGGVWAFIKARTKEEITKKYSELIVYDGEYRPTSMTDEDLNHIRLTSSFDIDDAPPGWLLKMTNE